MSTDVTTCRAATSVDHLMRLMTDRRIRHIPVLDGDRLAGIVSIGDVVKSRIDELETETSTLHDYLVRTLTARVGCAAEDQCPDLAVRRRADWAQPRPPRRAADTVAPVG